MFFIVLCQLFDSFVLSHFEQTYTPTMNPLTPTLDPHTPTTLHPPSDTPSEQPSTHPSVAPSKTPSTQPSKEPSVAPSKTPSTQPSKEPSVAPSNTPSRQPSKVPSLSPTSDGIPAGQVFRRLNPHGSTVHPSFVPSEAPTLQQSLGPQFWCQSGNFGDPHISTFDDLRFDCQAAGEFVMVKSLEDPSFHVQERFTAIDSSETCTQASVSTGVVIRDSNTPRIQISTPRSGKTSLNNINSCPIDFYFDGIEMALPNEDSTFDASGNQFCGWVEGPGYVHIVSNPFLVDWLHIYHTDTMVSLSIRVQPSDRFGCHFATMVSLPGTFRPDENLFGLLGTCNYDS